MDYLLVAMDWSSVSSSVAAGGSGPSMSRATATGMDARLCPPMNQPTATATAVGWLNPAVLGMRI